MLRTCRHREEFLWLAPFGVITVIAFALAWLAGAAVGVPIRPIFVLSVAQIWLFAPATLVLVLAPVTASAAFRGIKDPLQASRSYLETRVGSPALAAGTVVPLIIAPLLMGAFGSLKQLMPLVTPFVWDDSLARLDRLLMFGHQPWELTHYLFGSAAATQAIDRFYALWMPSVFLAVPVVATFADRSLRAQFFVSFAAAWMFLGVGAAFMFSSAGPCYAHLVGSASAIEYEPLMRRLAIIHSSNWLSAVDWQEVLWKAHADRRYAFGLGVSAMPSMHNAIAFLYLLASARLHITIRAAATAFAILVLVGSVHLGWHYAVDGLFAWGGMSVIWWGVGRYLRSCGYQGGAARHGTGPVELDGVSPDNVEQVAA